VRKRERERGKNREGKKGKGLQPETEEDQGGRKPRKETKDRE